jgi:hypothetical protein
VICPRPRERLKCLTHQGNRVRRFSINNRIVRVRSSKNPCCPAPKAVNGMIDVISSPEHATRKVMMPLIMPRTSTTPPSSGHSPMRANKQRELENYAQIHFRYTKFIQDRVDAIIHEKRMLRTREWLRRALQS